MADSACSRVHSLDIKCLSLRSQNNPPACSREKFQAKFLLQIRHSLANRRLSNMQVPGGFAIAIPLNYRGEVSKMPEFHTDRFFLSI
jgi:hypothetical protein